MSNATPGTSTQSIASDATTGQRGRGSGMPWYPAMTSATGSRIACSTSILAWASTRGSTTVLPAASAARTSGSVFHSLRNGSVSCTVRAAA